MPLTQITRSRSKILATLRAEGTHIFSPQHFRKLLDANRAAWRLGQADSSGLLKQVLDAGMAKLYRLEFPYRTHTRYVVGEASAYEIVQSISPRGYFSHFTAMFLSGLTLQVPKTLYFNVEQRMTPGGGTLTQAGLDRAFSGKARLTKKTARMDGMRVCYLEGGNTGRLGVVERAVEGAATTVSVTNVERTLIDATVRPAYSGGVAEVLQAFVQAKGTASANRIAAYLRQIGYTYPYHQAIGFYMQRAGYSERQLALLREFPVEFDFYLDYGIKQKEYDRSWRLYFPKGL
jgi:predicted transcriptional regulator of viral defense system